jgi:uroporphyrinogen decarboxylase
MNGAERLQIALKRGIPDRVPHMELAYNEGPIIGIAKHFTDNVPPLNYVQRMSVEDKIKLFEALLLFIEELDVDGVSLRVLGKNEDLDEKHVKDPWGVTYMLSPAGDSPVVDGPIKDESDLKGYKAPVTTEADLLSLAYGAAKIKGRRGVVLALRCPFRLSWSVMGNLKYLLIAYRRNPKLAHRLMRMTTDHTIQTIELGVKLGAEIVAMDGDLAFDSGTFMSPGQFRDFVAPYYAEFVTVAHRLGVPIVKHSDGDLMPIMPDLVAAGFDGIHPIQPQCMDLGEVKQKYGEKVCLLGNVDCMYVLTRGTAEDVEADVKRALAQGSPGGGYIITSSNTIHPDVKPENYITMVHALHKYGVYEGRTTRAAD